MGTQVSGELQQAIAAVGNGRLKRPRMPVDEFIRDCEKLCKRAVADKKRLLAVGMDWALVEKLQAGLQALRVAEAQWQNTRHVRSESERQWMAQVDEAYRLRDTLLDAMRFACRDSDHLLARVAQHAEGRSHGDMIQDLQNVATFARSEQPRLVRINFDMSLLDRAEEWAEKLGSLLGAAEKEREEHRSGSLLRNKTYLYVKQLADEIRAHGRYAFIDEPAHRDFYASPRTRGQSSPDSAETVQTEQTDTAEKPVQAVEAA